jgi:hypothetical protein
MRNKISTRILLWICFLVACCRNSVYAQYLPTLLSSDQCNISWHLDAKSKTLVYIGTESHPTRIAFARKQLAGLKLIVDTDANQFSIMSGLVTIEGQWYGSSKKT